MKSLQKLSSGIARIESSLKSRPWLAEVVLALAYLLYRAPEVFSLASFVSAVSPLEKMYEARKLVFPGGQFSPDLAKILVSPSSTVFVYPPGIMMLSYILPNLKSIYLFLFCAQLPVPFLVYRLFRKWIPNVWAAAIALLAIRFCTDTAWWSPDWLIQSLMLVAFLLLWKCVENQSRQKPLDLIALGSLVGLTAVFKHNVGIFLGICCATALYFRSFAHRESNPSRTERSLMYLLLAGYLCFGVFFISKVIYHDEIVFYLLPYFAFWGMTLRFIFRNKTIGLDIMEFLRAEGILIASALIIPVGVFAWIGGAVGYQRYWYSLFGMGFKSLHGFDYGILGIIRQYTPWSMSLRPRDINYNVRSGIYLLCFVFPFLVNCLMNLGCFRALRGGAAPFNLQRKCLAIGSIGIISVFMLFPLEGFHILASKLMIFALALVLLYSTIAIPVVPPRLVKSLLVALVLLTAMDVAVKPIRRYRMPTARGSPLLQKRMGFPAEAELSREMDKQLATMQRSLGTRPYYIIDTTMCLVTLKEFFEDDYRQYYLDFRKDFFDSETAGEVLSTIPNVPYLLVNQADYEKYVHHRSDHVLLNKILDLAQRDFVEVDRYDAPTRPTQSISQLPSFLVMKKLENPVKK